MGQKRTGRRVFQCDGLRQFREIERQRQRVQIAAQSLEQFQRGFLAGVIPIPAPVQAPLRPNQRLRGGGVFTVLTPRAPRDHRQFAVRFGQKR